MTAVWVKLALVRGVEATWRWGRNRMVWLKQKLHQKSWLCDTWLSLLLEGLPQWSMGDKSKSGHEQEHIWLIPGDKKNSIPPFDSRVKTTCCVACSDSWTLLERKMYFSALLLGLVYPITITYIHELIFRFPNVPACSCNMEKLLKLETKHAFKWLLLCSMWACASIKTSQTGSVGFLLRLF